MNNICFIEFIASFARKKMQSRIQIFLILVLNRKYLTRYFWSLKPEDFHNNLLTMYEIAHQMILFTMIVNRKP